MLIDAAADARRRVDLASHHVGHLLGHDLSHRARLCALNTSANANTTTAPTTATATRIDLIVQIEAVDLIVLYLPFSFVYTMRNKSIICLRM